MQPLPNPIHNSSVSRHFKMMPGLPLFTPVHFVYISVCRHSNAVMLKVVVQLKQKFNKADDILLFIIDLCWALNPHVSVQATPLVSHPIKTSHINRSRIEVIHACHLSVYFIQTGCSPPPSVFGERDYVLQGSVFQPFLLKKSQGTPPAENVTK